MDPSAIPASQREVRMPSALRAAARTTTLAGVPALLVHPAWAAADAPGLPESEPEAIPACVWIHGRAVRKEIDPGRFLRWMRAGVGAIALDLPGHGERSAPNGHSAARTPENVARMAGELDDVLRALRAGAFGPWFDLPGGAEQGLAGGRVGLGGMSAGGMAALIRLTDPEAPASWVRAVTVEATSGDLEAVWFPRDGGWPVAHDRAFVRSIDPLRRLAGGSAPPAVPLLAAHSESDEVIAWPAQSRFLDALADAYRAAGADAGLIERVTWPETGAPHEHLGFGRHAAASKDVQTAFLVRTLGAGVRAGASAGAERRDG